MNNVNMGGMNAMGGPVGGVGMPAMNNGTAPVRQVMPASDVNRSQLNTYIYEYFLRNQMYDCARSLVQSGQPMSLVKNSPGQSREGDGAGEDGGDLDSKDDIDSKRPEDLPAPNLPKDTPESCFLYEWWCLFWDMFNATRGKAEGRNVLAYVNHTQTASRMRQVEQQNVLRGLKGEINTQNFQNMGNMLRQGQVNGAMNNELRQRIIQNNRGGVPQNMMLQNKQQQMQRDPSNQDGQQRPQSPGSAENAPSPSKRPRLDGANFNPQQMPNGRGPAQGMPQQVGDAGPTNVQAAHMQLANGIEPNNLAGQQFQNMPGGNANQTRLNAYQANLAQQQQTQMPGGKGGPLPNAGGPQNQGSPMMGPGQENTGIANYYNPGDMGANGNRGQIAGGPGAPGGNHALQDYQMQLMLLEQQNKKRLMMARQEQDSMTTLPREGGQGPPGPGQIGPNGQQFQQGTSPQGQRSVNSPNPSEQMKRGTPHMAGGMPSPLPDAQGRGSPSGGMNFNMPGGPMDPNMNQPYFKMNGMDPNMVAGGIPNGMRPPSSHPGNGFPGPQMTPQQVTMMRQQAQAQAQAQQQQAQAQGWQQGPNGQMVQGPQGAPQQNMGTPQQRAMPPPSAPAPGNAPNGRTQPSSPQQGAAPPTPQQANKAISKKKADAKDSKAKRPAKKGSAANLNAGATPSAETDAAGATPTPQTPITPVHNFKGQNGAVQPPTNGQPPVQANNVPPQQNDIFPNNFDLNQFAFDPQSLEFNNNPNGDVLQDFDFDSFLHQDGDVAGEPFNFDSTLDFTDAIGAD